MKTALALLLAAPLFAATATFLRTDTTTKGTWKGVYGSDGYAIARDATKLPAWATVSFLGKSDFTWAASTTDIRGLQKSGPTVVDRVMGTWYSQSQGLGSSFSIDLKISDTLEHQAALYLFQPAGDGRTERVDVKDLTSGAVLDSQVISAASVSSGTWLLWTVSGNVRLSVFVTAGYPNSVASGLFLDPIAVHVPPPLTPPPPPSIPLPNTPVCGWMACGTGIVTFDVKTVVPGAAPPAPSDLCTVLAEVRFSLDGNTMFICPKPGTPWRKFPLSAF